MAKPGDVIEAPANGLRLVFIETESSSNGELLKFDYFMQPGAGYVRPHLHANQIEHYEIVSGTAVYTQDGIEKIAQPGEIVTNQPSQVHVNPWNRDGTEELHVRVEAIPSLGVEFFFETWFGLVGDSRNLNNKTKELNLLQNILTIQSISSKTYGPGIPIILQRAAYSALGLLARLRGYKGLYPEYIDIEAADQSRERAKNLSPDLIP